MRTNDLVHRLDIRCMSAERCIHYPPSQQHPAPRCLLYKQHARLPRPRQGSYWHESQTRTGVGSIRQDGTKRPVAPISEATWRSTTHPMQPSPGCPSGEKMHDRARNDAGTAGSSSKSRHPADQRVMDMIQPPSETQGRFCH